MKMVGIITIISALTLGVLSYTGNVNIDVNLQLTDKAKQKVDQTIENVKGKVGKEK